MATTNLLSAIDLDGHSGPDALKNQQHARSTLVPTAIAFIIALAHLLTNSRYGFHRDELQFLSDARHLDWGFVAYPPFTPFVERISMAIFGLSIVGLRLASVVAQAIAIVISGLMVRELGGGRLAQATTAIAVAFSPLALFEGTEFQYTTFDYLWWILIAYFVIRLLKSDDPRWFVAIGTAIGLGLMTKYSVVFFIAGVLFGMFLTPARRYFATRWFWAGIAMTLLICLPNLIWQARHGFISYHFLSSIHARDVKLGRADGFLLDQLRLCNDALATPLWIAGLIFFLRNRRYRMLAWMYLVPFALLFLAKGRGYYLSAAYPMLIAMGAIVGERWLQTLPLALKRTVTVTALASIVAWGFFIALFIIPFASQGPLRDYALKQNGDLREEIGWDELVSKVVAIRDTLPPDQRAHIGVVTGNYGEQGAIEILGAKYGLPIPISGTNSAWLRGYPSPAPTTLIVLGLSHNTVDSIFTDCRLAGRNTNSAGVNNEESEDHPDIFVCGPPRLSWPDLWRDAQDFG